MSPDDAPLHPRSLGDRSTCDVAEQPAGAGTDGTEMVRSQEQLRVGVETVVAARLRMRKQLVTEEQTFTVPVTREEITFDYEEIPPDQRVPDGGSVLAEEDTYEVIRYEERVVVTKQLIPVERVRLIRRVVATDRTVTGQVRTELIEFDQE